MKRSLSVIAIALFAVTAFAQQAADDWFWGKPIAAIQWDGVQHADRKELDAIVRSFVGKNLTEEVWSDLQAQVYGLDWFDNIDSAAFPSDEARTKVTIKFTVKEKPSVTSIRLSGNSGLRTTEVLDAVTEKVGDIYNASKSRLDELAIRKLYLEKGYPDAKVSSSTTAAADGGMVVTFFVVEGGQVAIREIHFTGLAAFTEQTLKGQLDLKEAGFLQAGAFQESKLETDRQKVVDYYRERGYVDAAVKDVVRTTSPDPKTGKSGLVLTFVISEGKQWHYGGIGFSGNHVFSADKLGAFFTQKPGAILNYTRLLQDKTRLDDLYYENGYIFNNIQLAEARDESKLTVTYTVNIVERDRAHIESLTFKGNTRTKDYVIAREMPLEVGDIFSKAKIIEGLRNLYNLQYFSSIEPQMMPGSDENLMDLVFSVEEQSTADIQFGITLSGLGTSSDTFPISGNIKWNEKNFLGTGRTVGVELNGSPTDQDVTLSYLDNWLFGKRISGGLNLSFQHKHLTTAQDILYPTFEDGVPDPYNSLAEYEAATSQLSDAYKMYYEYWALTAGASGGYQRHTPAGDFGFGGGLTSTLYNDMYDTTKYRPASKDIREVANQWLWTNKIPLRAFLNSLDLWYNPTSGYYLSQKLTWAGLITSVEAQRYIRTDSKAEAYVTLFNLPVFDGWNLKWVLGAHSSFSALLPHPGESQPVVSPSDDLRIDGTFTARGWSSLYSIDDGRALWDNWIELRMPIVDQYIWLDGFWDADVLATSAGLLKIGSAAASIDTSKSGIGQMGWDNLVMSMGFGLRFTIPQFPFRLYFAKRFSFDGSGINWKPAGSSGGLDFVISISQSLN